jgi:hypothetical protein
MAIYLRGVKNQVNFAGIPVRGQESMRKVVYNLLFGRNPSVIKSSDSVKRTRPSLECVSSDIGMVDDHEKRAVQDAFIDICQGLFQSDQYTKQFDDRALGNNLFQTNFRVTLVDKGREIYVLELIDADGKGRKVENAFSARLGINKAITSAQIFLEFWPFLPFFEINSLELEEAFSRLPKLSIWGADIRSFTAQERYNVSNIFARYRRIYDVRISLSGVDVFNRCEIEGNTFSAPYMISENLNDESLVKLPTITLTVSKADNFFIWDEDEKREVVDFSDFLTRAFKGREIRAREVRETIFPTNLEDFLSSSFHPQIIKDDILLCHLFRRLLYFARYLGDSQNIYEKMREIVELWEERNFIIKVDGDDDGFFEEANICLSELIEDLREVVEMLWKDEESRSSHYEKLISIVAPPAKVG